VPQPVEVGVDQKQPYLNLMLDVQKVLRNASYSTPTNFWNWFTTVYGVESTVVNMSTDPDQKVVAALSSNLEAIEDYLKENPDSGIKKAEKAITWFYDAAAGGDADLEDSYFMAMAKCVTLFEYQYDVVIFNSRGTGDGTLTVPSFKGIMDSHNGQVPTKIVNQKTYYTQANLQDFWRTYNLIGFITHSETTPRYPTLSGELKEGGYYVTYKCNGDWLTAQFLDNTPGFAKVQTVDNFNNMAMDYMIFERKQ
jgi:hypothetical protein